MVGEAFALVGGGVSFENASAGLVSCNDSREQPFALTLLDSAMGCAVHTLLEAGVTFRAALGNHDDPTQRLYEPFNMGGERYYSFKAPRGSVRTLAIGWFDSVVARRSTRIHAFVQCRPRKMRPHVSRACLEWDNSKPARVPPSRLNLFVLR